LRAADNQITVRDTVRGVAMRHGLLASFAPKPFPDEAGNGAHIHFSLWHADGRNAFHDPRGRYGLSDVGRAFIGGVLAHLPALVEALAKEFVTVKRSEVRGFEGKDTAFEIEQHFYKF